ncbi:MAG: hypothetical protein ACLQM8_27255, partial [Limisphaerales bacterium]
AVCVTGAALAAAATGSGKLLTVLEIMTMTKLKITVCALVVAGLGTTLVLDQRALARLREQNRALQERKGERNRLCGENRQLRAELGNGVRPAIPQSSWAYAGYGEPSLGGPAAAGASGSNRAAGI